VPNGYTVLIVTWMGGGNVRPVLDTARDLISRGHTVHVLSNPHMVSRVEETGATFHAFRRIPSHDPASPSTDVIRSYEGRNIGETNNIIAERLLFGPAEALCHDTLDLIDQVRPRVLMADYVLLGPMVAAEACDIPYLVASDGMYPLPNPRLPRGSSTYSYLFERMVNKWLPSLNRLRSSFGLQPIGQAADLYSHAARFLVNTYPALGGVEPPHGVVYAGPQFPPPVLTPAICERRRQKPSLVLGAFSTIFTPEQTLFIERLSHALNRLDVDAEIGTGSSHAEEIASPSPRIRIRPYIPLHDLLPQSRLLVNHAGNGTIVRAMAAGVPQLCVPFLQDQHDYARRISELGIGLLLPKSASVAEIERAVATLLEESKFLDKAEQEQARIFGEHQESHAARLIEEVIGAQHTTPGPEAALCGSAGHLL
jgi:UDP:flavonoid glycosyltransferase YjiC (YdhE family)